MPEIIFQTAAELINEFRAHRLTAAEVVEAYLAHIAQHNAAINAVVTLDAEGARRRARELDAQGFRADQSLWGIPVTLKDAWCVQGMRSTAGYPPLADYVPAEDCTIAARLRAAGAIILGKTNVPILSTDTQTHNEIFGRTNNPWNIDRTPGGSSGGSAASVASGMCAFDIGSDIAGSIRIPAHYCGVYGLKPTEFRVSGAGHIPPLPGYPNPVRRFGGSGPLARSIDDLELALRIIAGPDGHQVQMPPVPLPDAAEVPSLAEMRVMWVDRLGHVPITEDTERVLASAAEQLAGQGCTLANQLPPEWVFPDIWELYGTLYWCVVAAGFSPEVDAYEAAEAGFTPDSEDAFSRGAGLAVHASMRLYNNALVRRDDYTRALDRLLDEWDVLICPVTPTPAIHHMPHMSKMTVRGQEINYFERGIYYAMPFNLTGHPVVVIPAGYSADNLPIGIQIVGRRWDEIRLLAFARQIDRVINAYRRPPGF
jgi:amidase